MGLAEVYPHPEKLLWDDPKAAGSLETSAWDRELVSSSGLTLKTLLPRYQELWTSVSL